MKPVALHNHSCYSLLDGTMAPAEIVEAAAECGMPAVGLTDRDSLAGAVEFYKKARASGTHPVLGCEVTVALGVDGTARERIRLFVENAEGYRNLCRLLTTRIKHPEGVRPEDLNRFRRGLICLASEENLLYREIYEKNFAFEISSNGEPNLRRAWRLAERGRWLRIPVVATAHAHYRKPEDRLLYDIVASIRTLTLLKQSHPDKHGEGDYHFPSPEQIQRHFRLYPQSIENTNRIAERCQFDLELGDILFPPFPVAENYTPMSLLSQMARAGVLRRYGQHPGSEVWARLERELNVIEEVGYAEYFLIFADLVDWCRRQGIATLARGSAAGSLVCYALGISNVCPFRFGLCFERFLNKERMQFSKLADIDLDLPWDRRDEVVRYVFEKYGPEHVAMIGAFNTFQGRAAVADVAKVYGIPEREVRRFTEHMPAFMGDAATVLRTLPECRHLPWDEEPYRTILELAPRLEGIPRHASMHPCGLVISAAPITDRMPLFLSAKGYPTSQYAMEDVEELGLLKMDLLGQAGLSVLRDACANVRRNRGVEVDLETVDYEDAASWAMIATGNARGVFHIESPAMTSLLVMADCRDLDCLTAVESIIRPGAANEGKKRAFARRHQGLEPVTYAHPSLEPLLADTYGLLAYEEHILLVANGFAGMSWGRADVLRRALVKNKDRRKITEMGAEFRACALQLGRTPEEIEAVWAELEAFAGYMFNKAHSAAYAVEAFQGAWLKSHYPIEFLAAVLSNRRGFYAPIVYVLEALRLGARFLPPDVNLSQPGFHVEGETIRLPLDQVKGLTAETHHRIVEQRPFHDAGDFYRRVRPGRAEWLALLKVGALDSLGEPRGRLFWRLSRLEAAKAAVTGPLLATGEQAAAPLPEGAPSDQRAQARWEQELMGFPVSCHPLDYFAPDVDWARYVPAAEVSRHAGKAIDVCGLIVAERVHGTDRGAMKFLTLADRSGFMEVALFADAYRRWGHLTVQPVIAAHATAEPFDNRKGVTLNAVRLSLPVRAAGRRTAPLATAAYQARP
ncbi:MAG: DNA polymerase III subunit alpha [Bryobacteraceae bacterium]